jgi:betaine reductase
MADPVHNPVMAGSAYALAHVPDMVRHGSKPRRELARDAALAQRLQGGLRSFEQAVAYPPNQAFIGNLAPEELTATPRPWHEAAGAGDACGVFGEILHQDLFYALLARANVLQPPLIALTAEAAPLLQQRLAQHPVLADMADLPVTDAGESAADGALTLRTGDALRGWVRRDDRAEGREDDNLDAHTLLEALCTKASGAAALRLLLHRCSLAATDVDYLISCGEEAAGDRYQRGGGGMAKAIGEMCGCLNASGMDVKNFCAAPASALVTAGALVKAGVYRRVAVVAGGSLAKLGMKFLPLLREGMPILGDCLGCMAFLVTADDGVSPVLRLEPGAVGIARIGASTADEAIYRQLIVEPLAALGLQIGDVDRFAPELHNRELMEYSGSGDVAHKNYRMIAAMAVRAGVITRAEMGAFIERVGMPGFAPPQGHIPSGVPYLGHSMQAMARGELHRVMVICKASLFLNRVTSLYDGVSFVVEGRRG